MPGAVVTIIGGGFCGVMSAVHLLTCGVSLLRKVVLIEKQPRLGRGVAYGTDDDSHLLNVPVGRMSAFTADPDHFLNYLRARRHEYERDDFVPRKLYGCYLESLLNQAVIAAAPWVEFVRIHDRATDVRQLPGQRLIVTLASGDAISADRVIVACGNLASREPLRHLSSSLDGSTRYIGDPWAPQALSRVDVSQPVLLLGSGLSAIDITCSLMQRGFTHVIHMVSRHGLQPLPHGGGHGDIPISAELLHSFSTVRLGMHRLRTLIRTVSRQGHDWRDVLAAFRPHIPTVWKAFNDIERRRFLRHVQAYWDIHRHRLSPAVAGWLDHVRQQGKLLKHAGRVIGIAQQAETLRVTIRPRHASDSKSLDVGTIINCTGLCTDPDSADDALLANLRHQGLCRADTLGLGIACDDHYALLNAQCQPTVGLYYVGPYLRAHFWEATAVPELRNHVADLVRGLLTTIRATSNVA